MHTIRSFIAIPLSGEVQRAARKMLRELRGEKDGMKWVPEDNLHLTLKFLGDVVDRDVPAVCRVVRDCCSQVEPFELELQGCGGFPNLERPRVVWAGIQQGGESLATLVNSLEKGLATLGFRPDSRDYRPHLTLGRAGSSGRFASAEIVEKMKRMQDRVLGLMPVSQVRVYASFLDRGGPTYNVMDRIPLGAAAHQIDDEADDDIDDDNY